MWYYPTCDRGLIHQSSRKAGPIIYIQERASDCWRERAERELGREKSLLSCSDVILEMTGIINKIKTAIYYWFSCNCVFLNSPSEYTYIYNLVCIVRFCLLFVFSGFCGFFFASRKVKKKRKFISAQKGFFSYLQRKFLKNLKASLNKMHYERQRFK